MRVLLATLVGASLTACGPSTSTTPPVAPGSSGGTIAPGLSGRGTITFEGDVTFLATATLPIQLDAVNGSDLVIITGAFARAGTLALTVAPGYTPTLDDLLQILQYGTPSGAFTTINLPPVTAGLVFQLEETAGTPNVLHARAVLLPGPVLP